MRMFLAFVLGVLLACGVIWVVSDARTKQQVTEMGREAKREVKEAVDNIDTAEMKENLKETGRKVVETTKEAVSDASITVAIKTKLAANPDVPALGVDVDTTDGLVTLSGKVDTIDQVKRAVQIAAAVDGVRQVISVLQVKGEVAAVLR